MLRGHLSSIELARGILNPIFRRNFSAASVKYADDNDKKKAEGVFSWLKDIFKSDDRANETTTTVLDYPEASETSSNSCKFEDTANENSTPIQFCPECSQSYTLSTVMPGDVSLSRIEPRLRLPSSNLLILAEKTDAPIRTIVSCAPRNTTPPIREPNMPEKQDRKDDKKKKKNKKPVIRTDSAEPSENDVHAIQMQGTLLDNQNSNFRYQWGIRIPEEVVERQTRSKEVHHSNPAFVGSSNYSKFHVSSSQDSDRPQTVTDYRLATNSSDSRNETDAKIDLSNLAKDDKDIHSLEPIRNAQETSPRVLMDSGVAIGARDTLHNNLDVDFRYQFDGRIPEEVAEKHQELNTKETSSKDLRGGTSVAYNHQPSMCSADSESKTNVNTKLSTDEVARQLEINSPSVPKVDEVEDLESITRILKPSSSVKESEAIDEDYNIPVGMGIDAEVSAWKELALKSKVPVDPAKERSDEHAGLLSIRPEPPQPKLDVQAVPTANGDATRDEEDDHELPGDYKPNPKSMNMQKSGSSVDVRKIDSKKLHTGASIFFSRLGIYALGRKSRVLQTMNGDIFALEYSTGSDSSWRRVEETVTKEAEIPKAGHLADPVTNPGVPSNTEAVKNVMNEAGLSRDQQLPSLKKQESNPTESDAEFADSLNTIAEREIEISLSRAHQDDQNSREQMNVSSQRDSKKIDTEEQHMRSRSDDYHHGFSQYEDDFYPGYESMSMEPSLERSSTEKNREAHSNTPKDEREFDTKHDYETDAEYLANQNENYIIDGEYIKIPGDVYPYSRKYFNSWYMNRKEICIGPAFIETGPDDAVRDASTFDSRIIEQVEVKPPSRNMSHDARVETGGKETQHETAENLTNLSTTHNDDSNSLGQTHALESAGKIEEVRELDEADPKKEENVEVESIPSTHGVNFPKPRSKSKKPKEASLAMSENQAGTWEENIHNARKEQLQLVSKQEIEKIYELKNYAYLRPEEMKNLHFNVRLNPQAKNRKLLPRR